MATRVSQPGDIQPGDFYEDCAYHPCVCVRANGPQLEGISLVDGSGLRCCNVRHCGLRKLTADEVVTWKQHGPPDVAVDPNDRWW